MNTRGSLGALLPYRLAGRSQTLSTGQRGELPSKVWSERAGPFARQWLARLRALGSSVVRAVVAVAAFAADAASAEGGGCKVIGVVRSLFQGGRHVPYYFYKWLPKSSLQGRGQHVPVNKRLESSGFPSKRHACVVQCRL